MLDDQEGDKDSESERMQTDLSKAEKNGDSDHIHWFAAWDWKFAVQNFLAGGFRHLS